MADRDKETTDLAIIKGAVRKQALAKGLEKGEKIAIQLENTYADIIANHKKSLSEK